MKILTVGTFDLLHIGHIKLFKKCRLLAGVRGKVIVGLNPDAFVSRFKKTSPVMSYDERKKLLEELPYIDSVVENSGGKDSKILIRKVKPDMIVIGSDWARKDYYSQMDFTQDWLDENQIILCYVPYTKNISTTEIKKRMTVFKKRENKKQ